MDTIHLSINHVYLSYTAVYVIIAKSYYNSHENKLKKIKNRKSWVKILKKDWEWNKIFIKGLNM